MPHGRRRMSDAPLSACYHDRPLSRMDPIRPSVTIIVPFAGRAGQGRALLERLRAIDRQEDDEILLVDNSKARLGSGLFEEATIIRAAREWSSYHARNMGARDAAREWLLFTDSDCIPDQHILSH